MSARSSSAVHQTPVVVLRAARQSDAEFLLAWRNSGSARQFSASHQPIEFSDHQDWLKRTLSDEHKWIFIAEVAGVPCGSIRFEVSEIDQSAVISIVVDESFQRMGIGKAMLDAGTSFVRESGQRIRALEAVVSRDNRISVKLFEKSGFDCVSSIDHRFVLMTKNLETEMSPEFLSSRCSREL